ncbi:MAG: diacylglycerol kinase family lipid kinase [Capsulimonadaceae bacterium]|nr:diacylglycerol kinase family lipid kinase [Capsulimonadaceae bacterium]
MTKLASNSATITLIVNPAAGRGAALRAGKKAHAYLNAAGANAEIVYTAAKGDARVLANDAIERGSGIVAAVGGDGTLHEVANALLAGCASTVTLGLIPAGTGNDVARGLGLYGNIERACQNLLTGARTSIDVGRVRGDGVDGSCCFLGAAGLGFVADAARTVNDGVRLLSGRAAYLAGTILTLARMKPFEMGLKIDGQDLAISSGTLVSISNVETTGGGLKIAPGASPSDGLFDICFLGPVGRLEFLTQFPRVISGTHTGHPAVVMMRGQTVEVQTAKPKPLWIDGEINGQTPVVFEMMRGTLPMMLPEVRSLCETNR